jgi:hypothetical protein
MERRVWALVAASMAAPAAWGHHSFAPYFDINKPANISGTVTEYETRNPHSYLHIEAVDENGKTQEYVCESHGFTQLSRNGITPDMLKPGTRLRIDGSMSRHNPYMCFFNNVYFPDGRALNVNGPQGPQTVRAPGPARCRRDKTFSARGCSCRIRIAARADRSP